MSANPVQLPRAVTDDTDAGQDWRELEARSNEACVRDIGDALAKLEPLVYWADTHGQEPAASQTRQLAARWRSIGSDLANEARSLRAQLQG